MKLVFQDNGWWCEHIYNLDMRIIVFKTHNCGGISECLLAIKKISAIKVQL